MLPCVCGVSVLLQTGSSRRTKKRRVPLDIVLDAERRALRIKSYAKYELEPAMDAYADAERRVAEGGAPLDAVLVAGGGVNQLRRTYPNYFLDASMFIDRLERLCRKA